MWRGIRDVLAHIRADIRNEGEVAATAEMVTTSTVVVAFVVVIVAVNATDVFNSARAVVLL